MTWARDSSCTELVPYWELDMLTNAESVAVLSHHIWITSSYRLIEKIIDVFGGTRGNTQRRLTFQTHHMMRPVMMATQVTQQVSGLLLSSSMSLQQQHRQIRCTVRTSRLRTRPTAPTHARNISDWVRERERRQKSGKAFYFEEQVHLNQRCSTSHPQISVKKKRGCCCCCVVWSCQAGWPRRPKARQHWVKTTHRHQATLVCEDMCSRAIDQHYHRWLLQRGQKTKRRVVRGDEEPPPQRI